MDNEDELPGALQAAIGVAKQEWPHTMDAMVWAEKFAETFYVFPNEVNGTRVRMFQAGPESLNECKALMIGWFANAIMAGYDTAMSRSADRTRKALGELAGHASVCWNPKPEGIFDSVEAIRAVDLAMDKLFS